MTTDAASTRVPLGAVLLLALAIRLVVIAAGPYIIHPDELFQYYEQAHRVAFGSGVVPWEFHDGARSWLVPGILAAIMRLSRWVGSDPIVYIDAIRLLSAILSLTVVVVGFELARRRFGRLGAILTGALCAIWIDPVFFAPSLMGEVLSAYCILAAILLADGAAAGQNPRRMALIGVLLGLALCLRVQMGPALLVLAILCCRTEWRRRWLPLLLGGAVIVVLDLGLLDLLTWGSPFHSIWHYLLRGVFEKWGGGFSAQSEGGSLAAYARLIAAAWTPIGLPLAVLVVLGAFRLPMLAIVLLAVVVTHAVFANTEYRYICSALFGFPILMGIGAASLCTLVTCRLAARSERARRVAAIAVAALVVAYAGAASLAAAERGTLFRTLDRGTIEAYLTAHRQKGLCGLGVIGVGWIRGHAYTYLDRDVPLYGGSFNKLVMIEGGAITLRQSITLHGRSLNLFTDTELARNSALYNYLIAPAGHRAEGFAPVACFDNGAASANPKICLMRRPGGCEIAFPPVTGGVE